MRVIRRSNIDEGGGISAILYRMAEKNSQSIKLLQLLQLEDLFVLDLV